MYRPLVKKTNAFDIHEVCFIMISLLNTIAISIKDYWFSIDMLCYNIPSNAESLIRLKHVFLLVRDYLLLMILYTIRIDCFVRVTVSQTL